MNSSSSTDVRPADVWDRGALWRVLAVVAVLVLLAATVGIVGRSRLFPADPETISNHAWRAFQERKFADAEAGLAQLARLRAPTPSDRMLKGQVAMSAGRTDEAIGALAQVPTAHQFGPTARMQAGQLELRRFRARAGEALLLEAASQEPHPIQVHRELIFLYGMQSRFEALRQQFRQLGRRVSLTLDDVFLWCLTRGLNWDPDEITDLLRKYVAADPQDLESRWALAENLRQRSRLDEAEAALVGLPESDPETRVVLVRIAQDRSDTAKVERLLADAPETNAELVRMRGKQAILRRDAAEAVRLYRIAERLDPDHRDTIFGLAQAYRIADQAEEAAPYLARARDYDALGALIQKVSTASQSHERVDPDLLRQLGAAFAKVGRKPEARAWYKLALVSDPLNADVQKRLHELGPDEDAD